MPKETIEEALRDVIINQAIPRVLNIQATPTKEIDVDFPYYQTSTVKTQSFRFGI